MPSFTQAPPAPLPPARVLLVDDQPLFLESLHDLLHAHGFTVVGIARDGLRAIELARALRPEVVVTELKMPMCSGLEAVRRIKAEMPDVKIVVLTAADDQESLIEALCAGASGYLLKNLDRADLIRLLAAAICGEAVLAPGLVGRVLAELGHLRSLLVRESAMPFPGSGDQRALASGTHGPPGALTARQVEILAMIAAGQTYREVGEALCLSEHTVRYHVREILNRLQVQSRAQAIAFAAHNGLIPPHPPTPNPSSYQNR